MSNIPENLYYSDTHEWLRIEQDGTITMGVTDHAQEAMGDMVFVDLPEVGKKITKGAELGVLESVKSASDVYAPINGEVIQVNEALRSTPDLVNKSPYEDGWIARIKPNNIKDVELLMNPQTYKTHLAE